MEKQYWVGDIFVDLSRNQISHLDQIRTLPPKALQVLTCLARHQGQVVSYQEILEEVWPNAIVSPNTLQSSIAQLRKVLSGLNQLPEFIRTHAKQGYSLECDVKWQKPHSSEEEQTASDRNEQAITLNGSEIVSVAEAQSPPKENSQHQNQSRTLSISKPMNFYLLITTAAMFLLIFFVSTRQEPTSQLDFNDLRYLTATDHREFGASYAADGKFILFNRYYEQMCSNTIWAKNTDTLEEIQITNEIATYEGHSLSPYNNSLVYIEQNDCTQPLDQESCYRLMQLNFAEALTEPQTPSTLLDCQKSAINTPIWIDAHHIVMRQRYDQRWRLIRVSIENNESTVLYEIPDGHVSSVSWSPQQNLFAVSSLKGDGQQYIEMLHMDGQIKSSHRIQLPKNSLKYLKVAPQFMPNSELLLFGFGSKLFTLTQLGAVNKVKLPFDTNIYRVQFHPDGDRLLLVKGIFDRDIARFTFTNMESGVSKKQNLDSDMSIIERSIASEHLATFQPGSNAIAFASARTGTDQVWLSNNGGKKILTDFPNGSFIQNLIWSNNGASLLVYANWQIHKLIPGSALATVEFPHLVTDLFHWDSEEQVVVANILVDGISKFVKINLNSLEYDVINNKTILWAVNTEQNELIYLDNKNQFWQPGVIEDQLIEVLSEHGAPTRFLYNENVIYGFNNAYQLWSYELHTGRFKALANVMSEVDYLTDIRGNELLTTLVIDSRKEVVELSLVD